jgi:hypothetical protein
VNLVLSIPEPGQLVDAWQRRFVVVNVAQSVLSLRFSIVNFFCLTPYKHFTSFLLLSAYLFDTNRLLFVQE